MQLDAEANHLWVMRGGAAELPMMLDPRLARCVRLRDAAIKLASQRAASTLCVSLEWRDRKTG